MTRRPALVCMLALAATLPACGGAPPPSPPPPPPKPVAAPPRPAPAPAGAQPGSAVTQVPMPTAPGMKYEAKGRRDPFQTLEAREGAGGLTVAATKLTGIVRGSHSMLALVETADGIGYILKPGDALADGRVLEIGKDSVTFTVTPKPGSTSTRLVLKLATN